MEVYHCSFCIHKINSNESCRSHCPLYNQYSPNSKQACTEGQVMWKVKDIKKTRRYVSQSGSHLIADLKTCYPCYISPTYWSTSQWRSFAVIYSHFAKQKSQYRLWPPPCWTRANINIDLQEALQALSLTTSTVVKLPSSIPLTGRACLTDFGLFWLVDGGGAWTCFYFCYPCHRLYPASQFSRRVLTPLYYFACQHWKPRSAPPLLWDFVYSYWRCRGSNPRYFRLLDKWTQDE